jgi:hypothetical protein
MDNTVDTRKDFAAFTITRNEPLFLRVWLNYYTSVFPPEDIYVIDNSTADTSVEEARVLHPRVNFVFQPSVSAHISLFLKRTVESQQTLLLKNYKVVVFSETDEYLIPTTRYSGLRDYCEQFLLSDKQHVRAQGWNVVQQPDNEASVGREPGQQILADRSSMWRLPVYDKSLVTKRPLTYTKGFHVIYVNGTRDYKGAVDEDLSLFHAWCVDVDEFYRRHGERLKLADRAKAEELFRNVTSTKNSYGDVYAVGDKTPVPEHWRPLLTC